MLLAPMLYEDQVLGVLVLSKLGLHQFRDDDLRLVLDAVRHEQGSLRPQRSLG